MYRHLPEICLFVQSCVNVNKYCDVYFVVISVRATTTSTDDVDLLAIDLFATMVQQYEAFITLDATKIIAEKFKSTNADEVLLALNVSLKRKVINTHIT